MIHEFIQPFLGNNNIICSAKTSAKTNKDEHNIIIISEQQHQI